MVKKESQKLYREKNKDKIKEASKLYWDTKKDFIKARRKELVTCNICNSQVTRESFYRHKKTNYCQSKKDLQKEIDLKKID